MQIDIRRPLVLILVLVLVPATVLALGEQRKKKKTQDGVRAIYNAGSYAQVLEEVDVDSASPEDLYLAGRSADALDRDSEAGSLYERLAGHSGDDVWRHIGASARAITNKAYDDALTEAEAAVEAAPGNAMAHYQRGHALAFKRDFEAAAAAFREVLEIDPDFAYAHYYAGMSFYRTKEIGPMANHLQRFQELAPEAPEQTQVASILRSVQG